jgi:hypothetical protein
MVAVVVISTQRPKETVGPTGVTGANAVRTTKNERDRSHQLRADDELGASANDRQPVRTGDQRPDAGLSSEAIIERPEERD